MRPEIEARIELDAVDRDDDGVAAVASESAVDRLSAPRWRISTTDDGLAGKRTRQKNALSGASGIAAHRAWPVSQRFRKRVEEVFGWLKTVGLCRQTRYRGRERVGWMFTFAVAAYNLVRLRTLRAAAA